jgi:hypothetical protein
MQKILGLLVILLVVGTGTSVPVSKRSGKVVSLDETIPTEFLQKFQKAATRGGMLEPGAKVGAKVEAKAEHMPTPTISSKTAPRSSNPTNPAKELSYKVIQTIKGSYSALGPLQCESTCTVKEPKPTCDWVVPPCALTCAEKCAQGTNEVELHRQLCVDGCSLFCGVSPESLRKPDPAGATEEMQHREKYAREEKAAQRGKVGMDLAKKGLAGDKITTQD